MAMLESLDYIANNYVDGSLYKSYLNIPENEKTFFDVIIRNAKTLNDRVEDIGIMYQEKLVNGKIEFIPKIEKIEKLSNFYGHKLFDANESKVLDEFGNCVKVNNENVFVIINNEKITLF